MKGRKFFMRSFWFLALAMVLVFMFGGLAAAADKPTLVFEDLGWDTARVHNRIAAFILEHGYGYKIDYVDGETIMLAKALIMGKPGSPNINMETWTDNWLDLYAEGEAKGKDPNTNEGFVWVGNNFPNSVQGFWVPTYMIKGDPKRNIKATIPNVKSVEDMKAVWEIFKDPEDPSKGRFYSCIPGWSCQEVNMMKFKEYGLDKNYNIMEPGSGAALAGSMEGAYKKGEPWFGYYWDPTWIMGKLDMTMLEEPPYSKECWDGNKACAYPAARCDIIVHKSLVKTAPDVVEFLSKYHTTMDINRKFLLHMQETGGKPADGAMWFLKNYEDLWTKWVSPEIAQKVKAAMK